MGCVSGWRNRNDDRIVSRSHVQPSVKAVMQKLFVGAIALVLQGCLLSPSRKRPPLASQIPQSVTPTSPIRGPAFQATPAIRAVLLRSARERRDRRCVTPEHLLLRIRPKTLPGTPGGKSGPPAKSPSSANSYAAIKPRYLRVTHEPDHDMRTFDCSDLQDTPTPCRSNVC